MRNYILLILIGSVYLLNSQIKFVLPVENPIVLSNFCELRETHFHAGLDFKGYYNTPIYSIYDGYLHRIKVEPGGFGQAIYLKHFIDSGYISVYAHLNSFTDTIQKIVRKIQYEKKSFSIDTTFENSNIFIKQKQIIGYIGNKGYSFGPHLHFEIRNLNDEPLNPMIFYSFGDSFAPRIEKIFFYYPCQFSIDSLFYTFETDENSIIFTPSHFYIGIETYDFIDKVFRKLAPYEIKVFFDGEIYYHVKFNKLSFDKKNLYPYYIDYKLQKTKKINIHKCYSDSLTKMYHHFYAKNNGIFQIYDTLLHTIKIVVNDFQGNSTSKILKIKKKDNFSCNYKNFNYLIIANQKNYIKKDFLILIIDKFSFNKDFFLDFKIYADTAFYLSNKFLSLLKPSILLIDTAKINFKVKSKLILVNKNNKKDIFLIGNFENSFFKVEITKFGYYKIDVDTTSPVIKPLNFSRNQKIDKLNSLKFKITDDKSGVKTYNAYINDHWEVLEYDLKNDMLILDLNNINYKGKLKITITARDYVGNQTVYETTVYR